MTELRTTTRDLFTAAEELEQDAADIEEQIEDLEQEVREEYDEPEDIPVEKEQTYQRLKAQYRELVGTAETYKRYAAIWTPEEDAETCEFVLSELNGDSFAKVMDTVQAEAQKDGTVPNELGKVESLRYALEDVPEDAPSNPGKYPAAIVGELYIALQSITSPPEVEAGNEESLRAVLSDGDPVSPADGAAMFDGPTTSPAGEK